MGNGIGFKADKAYLERSGENGLGQKCLQKCDCGHMPSGGHNVKKKT